MQIEKVLKRSQSLVVQGSCETHSDSWLFASTKGISHFILQINKYLTKLWSTLNYQKVDHHDTFVQSQLQDCRNQRVTLECHLVVRHLLSRSAVQSISISTRNVIRIIKKSTSIFLETHNLHSFVVHIQSILHFPLGICFLLLPLETYCHFPVIRSRNYLCRHGNSIHQAYANIITLAALMMPTELFY